jgi:hypothetical protein
LSTVTRRPCGCYHASTSCTHCGGEGYRVETAPGGAPTVVVEEAPSLGVGLSLAQGIASHRWPGARPVACFGSISRGRLVGVAVRFERGAP